MAGPIILKKAEEIEAMARSGAIIGRLYETLAPEIKPGMSTGELDRMAEEFIRSHDGAIPAFKGLYGFPGSMCISLNEEVVHGIPSLERILQEGDILSLDTGVKLNGWCSDSAWTFPVGEVDAVSQQLLEVTERALDAAVEASRVGGHIGDIGAAVEGAERGPGFLHHPRLGVLPMGSPGGPTSPQAAEPGVASPRARARPFVRGWSWPSSR